MFRFSVLNLGGAIGRAAAAGVKKKGGARAPNTKTKAPQKNSRGTATAAAAAATTATNNRKNNNASKRSSSSSAANNRAVNNNNTNTIVQDDDDDYDNNTIVYASNRPAYMSEDREKEVLTMAERMQRRDLSGEVPVASFAFDILKAHPSVRDMGLRERMDFLCLRWSKLSRKKQLEYINDPLKGLL